MADVSGGEPKDNLDNMKDVQNGQTASESKNKDKDEEPSEKQATADSGTNVQVKDQSDNQKEDEAGEEIIHDKVEITFTPDVNVEKDKNSKENDTKSTEMEHKPIQPEIREVKKSENSNENRKSIFKDGQSKSDIQENQNTKIQSISYVKDQGIEIKNKPIIKDTHTKAVGVVESNKEKKVQIKDEKSDMKESKNDNVKPKESKIDDEGVDVVGMSNKPEEGEEIDKKAVAIVMNGKQEDDDITTCESDEDSDKDCMLDIKTNEHVCEHDNRPRKDQPFFGFSLSKSLRRRYIVGLGVMLAGMMLGIILFGIIRAASNDDENTSENPESYGAAGVSPTDLLSIEAVTDSTISVSGFNDDPGESSTGVTDLDNSSSPTIAPTENSSVPVGGSAGDSNDDVDSTTISH